jgi:hypothetical protein
MDLIRAQTELALRATNEQLACHLGREVTEIRELILTILAHIEAYIDFPDEEIDPDTGSAFLARILQLEKRLDKLNCWLQRTREESSVRPSERKTTAGDSAPKPRRRQISGICFLRIARGTRRGRRSCRKNGYRGFAWQNLQRVLHRQVVTRAEAAKPEEWKSSASRVRYVSRLAFIIAVPCRAGNGGSLREPVGFLA